MEALDSGGNADVSNDELAPGVGAVVGFVRPGTTGGFPVGRALGASEFLLPGLVRVMHDKRLAHTGTSPEVGNHFRLLNDALGEQLGYLRIADARVLVNEGLQAFVRVLGKQTGPASDHVAGDCVGGVRHNRKLEAGAEDDVALVLAEFGLVGNEDVVGVGVNRVLGEVSIVAIGLGELAASDDVATVLRHKGEASMIQANSSGRSASETLGGSGDLAEEGVEHGSGLELHPAPLSAFALDDALTHEAKLDYARLRQSIRVDAKVRTRAATSATSAGTIRAKFRRAAGVAGASSGITSALAGAEGGAASTTTGSRHVVATVVARACSWDRRSSCNLHRLGLREARSICATETGSGLSEGTRVDFASGRVNLPSTVGGKG